MNDFITGFQDELQKIAKKTWKEEKKFIRKAGPATGAVVGAGLGAAYGAKKGKGGRGKAISALAGMGTGATIGWLPDIGWSASEGLKRYKKKGTIPKAIKETVKEVKS